LETKETFTKQINVSSQADMKVSRTCVTLSTANSGLTPAGREQLLPQQSFLQVSVFTRNVITRRAIVLA
jgi:hypothetical protein